MKYIDKALWNITVRIIYLCSFCAISFILFSVLFYSYDYKDDYKDDDDSDTSSSDASRKRRSTSTENASNTSNSHTNKLKKINSASSVLGLNILLNPDLSKYFAGFGKNNRQGFKVRSNVDF